MNLGLSERGQQLHCELVDFMENRVYKGARMEIAAIKLVAPATAEWVLDRAVQPYGGAGFSDDTPLAMMLVQAPTMRVFDGPHEVHEMSLAKRELRRYQGARS